MDYLVRDAHHTGVPYGTIDHGRLVRELTFADGELVLDEGNVQTAESLLVARALMNPTVYSHSVARISKAMLRRAGERLLDTPAADVDAERLQRMDDHDLIVALRSCEATGEFSRRLDQRDLFKRAVWAEIDDVPGGIIEADHETIREFEREAADRADIDPAHVILDVPSRPSMTESTTRVMVNGEIRRLGQQSPLVEALRAAQYSQWRLESIRRPNCATESVGPPSTCSGWISTARWSARSGTAWTRRWTSSSTDRESYQSVTTHPQPAVRARRDTATADRPILELPTPNRCR